MKCHFEVNLKQSRQLCIATDMTTSLEAHMRKIERDCLFHYNDNTTLRL